MSSSDLPNDAEARYREAKDRRDRILRQWRARRSPLLAKGSTGQLVEHPLVKMLREHDMLLQKLAEPLQKRHRGPSPSAVVHAGIGDSPAAKLRLAK